MSLLELDLRFYGVIPSVAAVQAERGISQHNGMTRYEPSQTEPQPIADLRLLTRLSRPLGHFNTEQLGVLGVQSLKAG